MKPDRLPESQWRSWMENIHHASPTLDPDRARSIIDASVSRLKHAGHASQTPWWRRAPVWRMAAVTAAIILLVRWGTSPRLSPASVAGPVGSPVGSIEELSGAVTIRTPGVRTPRLARPGDPLGEHDRVETAQGRVRLRLGSHLVRLAPQTDLEVAAASPACVDLTKGSVIVTVHKGAGGFSVRTPLGDADALGTEFQVSLKGGTSMTQAMAIVVFSGIVAVHNPKGRIELNTKERATITEGDGPRRTPAPQAPDASPRMEPAPLHCPIIAIPPTLDGNLSEADWQSAQSLTEGPVIIKALINGDALYVGVECQDARWPKAPKSLQRQDDPALKDAPHLDLAVCSSERTTLYRVLLTSGGAVYDVVQRRDADGTGWANDLSWSSRTTIKREAAGKAWSAEFAVPLTAGFLKVEGKKGSSPRWISQGWHPLLLDGTVNPSSTTSSTPPVKDLRTLSDDELMTLAAEHANQPGILERANAAKSLRIRAIELLGRDDLPDEARNAQLLDLVRESANMSEWTMGAEAAVKNALTRMPKSSKRRDPEKKEANANWRKQEEHDQIMMSAASLPAFLQQIQDRFGPDALDDMRQPGPKTSNNSIFTGLGLGEFYGSKLERDAFPANWTELTEEQFQSLRQERLQAFTDPGIVLGERRVKHFTEFMGGSKTGQPEKKP